MKIFDFTSGQKGKFLADIRFCGEVYKLTGLNTRARRMPFQAERISDGTKFKFPDTLPKILTWID